MNSLSGINSYDTILTLDGLSQFNTTSNNITDAYIAADQVVKDACVLKTGSTMTGGLVVSGVQNPIQLTTVSTPLTMTLSAGSLAAPQVCTLKLCSTSSSNLDFRNYSDVSQASMFYASVNSELRFNVGTNTNVFRIGGTQVTAARNLSMGTTNRIVNLSPGTTVNDAVNFGQSMLRSGVNASLADQPMGGFKITGLGSPSVGTDAASKNYVDTADTTLSTALTNAYTSADALKLNLTGGNITGAITSSIVQPLNFMNSTGPVQVRLSAGTSSVIQLATIQMCSNSAGIIDFQGNDNITKAKIQYTYGTPGAISLIVGGSQVLSASDTTLACGLINMQQNRIFNLAPTPTTDQDAVPRLYMANADSVVAANATAALTVEVNARVAAIGAEASTRAAQDAAVLASSVQKSGGTMTGSLTFSGGNINMGTGYIGLQNGVSATDAVNKQQMEAGDATVASNASSALTTGLALKLDKYGSSPLTINGVQNAFNATNTGGTLNTNYTAGTAAAPQSYYQIMTSNVQSLLDFRGNDGVQRAFFRYLYGAPGALELSVNNTLLLSVAPSTINMYQTLNMNNTKVQGAADATALTDLVTLSQLNTKTYLRTSATSNGTLVISDPLSNKTVVAVTNTAAFSETILQMQGTTNLITAGNASTGAVTSGFSLLPTSLQYFVGSTPTGNAKWSYDAGVFTINGRLDVAGGVIGRDTWASGETKQKKFLAPARGDGLVNSTCTKLQGNVVVISTSMTVVANNFVYVKGSFNLSATADANDKFRMVAQFSSLTDMTFTNAFPTVAGFRERSYTFKACFKPLTSGSKTIQWRLYNDTDVDTIDIDTTNWLMSVSEVKA